MPLSSVIGSSSIMQPGVCTSTTRPASPYDGQMIYETDTDKTLVWNGSAWYANWNTAWGHIGRATATTSQTFNSASLTDFTGLSVTFTAIANRLYKIGFSLSQAYGNSGDRFTVHIVGSTTLYETYNSVSTYGWSMSGFVISTFSSGSQTIKLRAARDVGSSNAIVYASSTAPMTLLVEDIGPA